MESLQTLPTDIILSSSQQVLGSVYLDSMPQPGQDVSIGDRIYTVLERRHQYQLRGGRYQLHKMVVFVQLAPQSEEKHWMQGRWILGDPTCRFNAQSELVRCAVNPMGPCQSCGSYEPRSSESE